MINCNCRNGQKSTAVIYNPNSQTLDTNDFAGFTSAKLTGCNIQFNAGTTPAILKRQGIYFVTVDANLIGTAAGPVTLQLLNNNVPVQNAEATFTAAEGTDYHISITTVIEVLKSCCCNRNIANLQLQVLNNGVEINNVSMTIVKLE